MSKLYRCLYFVLALLLTSRFSFAKTDIYFSPSTKCENSIIKLIKQSEKSIDIAVYSINNKNIVKALKDSHDKGVNIRILTDKQQAASKNSKVLELYNYGINIRVHSKFKIEHNKFAVFDNKYASMGETTSRKKYLTVTRKSKNQRKSRNPKIGLNEKITMTSFSHTKLTCC